LPQPRLCSSTLVTILCAFFLLFQIRFRSAAGQKLYVRRSDAENTARQSAPMLKELDSAEFSPWLMPQFLQNPSEYPGVCIGRGLT
jgi:hypothetical protein